MLGVTGSGKTTAGRRIAAAIDAAHIELDALYWGPDWTESPPELLRERVRDATDGRPRWVTDGGYARHIWDITWTSCDTIVWLDYPLPLSMWRLFRRTMRRLVQREELWSGNHEHFHQQFLNRDSLFIWAVKSHRKYKETYPEYFARAELSHVQVLRLRRPRAFEGWVTNLEGMPAVSSPPA